ncbi:unnamed protein product [Schistosoma mattheei]|uniref:Uncharacterized protein n=1 Tax=Schistosoma mattheei TaxID=31246 RepID=A0A183P5U1_9TREM|nr:unnamed protein product [Schistosoma mattheei]
MKDYSSHGGTIYIKSLRTKLDCLYNILHNACPSNAVRLIMNYFKETLPDGCTFNYETRLSKHLESLQMTNLINNDENIDEMNMRKQTVINNLNQIEASPIKSLNVFVLKKETGSISSGKYRPPKS